MNADKLGLSERIRSRACEFKYRYLSLLYPRSLKAPVCRPEQKDPQSTPRSCRPRRAFTSNETEQRLVDYEALTHRLELGERALDLKRVRRVCTRRTPPEKIEVLFPFLIVSLFLPLSLIISN